MLLLHNSYIFCNMMNYKVRTFTCIWIKTCHSILNLLKSHIELVSIKKEVDTEKNNSNFILILSKL